MNHVNFSIEVDIELVLYFISFIICAIIQIFVIKNIFTNPANEFSPNNRLPRNTVILCVLGMIGFILNLLTQICHLIDVGVNDDIIGIYFESFSYVFLFFGVSMGHLLFMDRLSDVFSDAVTFRISYKTIKIFQTLVIIFFSTWIIFTIVHILEIHSIISHETTDQISIILLWFGAFIDIIITIILSSLFTQRLFMLSLSVSDEKIEVETKQTLYPILDSITRYFILTIVSISVVLIILIFGCFWDTLDLIHYA